MSGKLDLKGQKFGRWAVLEEAGKSKRGAVLWRCICNCGTEKIIEGSSMKSGDTKSCGCYRAEAVSRRLKGNVIGTKIDLTGKIFGKLTVLREAGRDKYGNVLWLCKCECGVEKVINGHSLRSGHTKACGGKGSCHHCYKDGLSNTKEYDRKYYKKHKKRYKEYDKRRQLKDDPKWVFVKLKSHNKKGTPIEFTEEEFIEWYSAQPKICHYCDRSIGRTYGKGTVPSGISIDRKDSKRPYSEENCVLCCRKCNLVKNDFWTYKEMKTILGPLCKQKWQSTVT